MQDGSAQGGEVKIATTNAANRKILEITRLDRQLEVFQSVIDAVQELPNHDPHLGQRAGSGRPAGPEGLPHASRALRRWSGSARAGGTACWARSSSTASTAPRTRSSNASPASTACPTPSSTQRLFDPQVVDVLPREYIENNLVLPLFVVRGMLTIAVPEPSNLFLIDEIRSLSELEVQIVAATAKDIRRMITSLPNSKVFVIDDIIEDSEAAERHADRGGHRGHRRHRGRSPASRR